MTQIFPAVPAPGGPVTPGGEAPGRLAERTVQQLYALALRITGGAREAEDVVEQTLVEAGRADPAPTSELRFEALVRRCRDLALVRSGKRSIGAVRQRRPVAPRAGAAMEHPAFDSDAVRAAAAQAKERLAVDDRLALEMVYFEGYSLADVAASLRMSPHAVRAGLRRARAAFTGPAPARVLIALSAPPAQPAPRLRGRLLAALARGA